MHTTRSLPNTRERVARMLLTAGFTPAERAGSLVGAMAEVEATLDATGAGLSHQAPEVFYNAVIAAGLSGTNGFWRERCVETGRALARELWDGADPADLLPRRFRVSIHRRFAAPTGRRVRLPRPIEDAALGELSIRVDASDGATVRIGEAAIDVSPVRSAEPCELAAEYMFVARGGGSGTEPPPGPEIDWRAEREGVIDACGLSGDALAIAGEGDAETRARRLFDHLMPRVRIGMLDWQAVADPASSEGWMDCRTAAARFVSLCRAGGLPARLVGGYLLWAAPAEHYWAEVWTGAARGWTPFDFLAWDLSGAGADSAWRSVYAGALDYRMKTQIFPRKFTGASGADLSRGWHRVFEPVPRGVRTAYLDPEDGRELMTETVSVSRS